MNTDKIVAALLAVTTTIHVWDFTLHFEDFFPWRVPWQAPYNYFPWLTYTQFWSATWGTVSILSAIALALVVRRLMQRNP